MAAENQDSGNTPSAAGAGGVGSLLRETRRQLGHDLDTVATTLRIRQPYLLAIEDGRFQDLPGATYAVGFVRGYAEFLGLDSKEILRRFKQENGEYAARAELVFPSAVSEGSIPTGALLGIAVIAAAAAYGAWYWYQSRDASVAEAVPALPDRLAALIHRPVGNSAEVVPVLPAEGSKPAETAATGPAEPQAAVIEAAHAPTGTGHDEVVPPTEDEAQANNAAGQQAVAGAATPSPAPAAAPSAPEAGAPAVAPPPLGAVAPAAPATEDVRSSVGKVGKAGKLKEAKDAKSAAPKADTVPAPGGEASPPPANATATAPAAGAAEPDTNEIQTAAAATPARGSPRIVLNAAENCWVEIRDANGHVVSTRMLHKGDSYAVPNRPGLSLTAGNAGALSVMVDGKVAPSLGAMGVVRRNIPLDSERLTTPVKEDPAPVKDESPAAGGSSAVAPAPTE